MALEASGETLRWCQSHERDPKRTRPLRGCQTRRRRIECNYPERIKRAAKGIQHRSAQRNVAFSTRVSASERIPATKWISLGCGVPLHHRCTPATVVPWLGDLRPHLRLAQVGTAQPESAAGRFAFPHSHIATGHDQKRRRQDGLHDCECLRAALGIDTRETTE